MGPIGSSPSPIDKIPDEIKLEILKCLGPVDATVTSKMDKIWQQFANKPIFWSMAAKKLNITVDQKNPKQGVLEYLQYHPINEAFKNLVVGESISKDNFANTFITAKTEGEKYQALIGHLKSFQNSTESPFLDYLKQICEEKKPTPSELRIAKKLIEDDVIQGDYDFAKALNTAVPHSLEIFTLIIEKAHPKFDFIANGTLEGLAGGGPNVTPFIQVLLQSGAIPTERNLVDTATGVFFNGADSMALILDYSSEDVRQKAVKSLYKDEVDAIRRKDTDNAEDLSRMQRVIENASPATFGGQATVKGTEIKEKYSSF